MSDEFLDEVEMRFLRKYWRMALVFVAVIAAAVIGAALVLVWFVAIAQTTALVPATLGLWSIGHVILFILHLVFWEIVLVGSWVLVIVLVIIFQWYMKLPEKEREGWPKRGRREESDAFSFLVGITWLIVVWVDGRWNLAFESWTFNDWVYSFLAALAWDLLIFGVPIALGFLWWIRKEMEKEPQSTTETVEEIADEPSEE
ncbi:MAG: hypothetical protein ACXADL_16285 [Candidatus Thorarchaeota archaeon]|jgi:hypothetical protein